KAEQLWQIISADQIQKRVKEMARQIPDDFRGKTVHVLGVLENSFVFMADLVRALEPPLVCTFINPQNIQKQVGQGDRCWRFFSVTSSIFVGNTCLLVEGLVHSGVTAEFLMSDLRARGAATVKLAVLLDRQMERRVQLQPD